MAFSKKAIFAISGCVILVTLICTILAEMLRKESATGSQTLSVIDTSPQMPVTQYVEQSGSLPHRALAPKKNELKDQIHTGDLKAAQQILHGVMQCKRASDMERGIRKALDKPIATGLTPKAAVIEEGRLKHLQEKLTTLTAQCETWGDLADEELDRNVYDALLAAGRLGDRDAANCYIVAPFEASSLQNDPAAFEEYKRNATDLIEKGIAAGDWVMVDILDAGSSTRRGRIGWFNNLLVHDDLASYKYKRLMRLGAAEEFAEVMDQELARLTKRLEEQGGLAPADILAADQWSQEMYRQYFAAGKPLVGRPAPCVDPYREFHE